ncbi:O-methyltransferase [Corynebacterium epidermidicanis]|uniref:Putative O-methyltransferase n=1 Tax=Corynebacterium epidermidicanis TaxID=1050174 RepID=A0A0G3GQJ0_9CORY|nr:class I SAM-dependent methyltransferase [Corynebacterium epidermidicanis]AKK02825.1 putative O-methyltransferase [Corynebacterium epidermidicanis]
MNDTATTALTNYIVATSTEEAFVADARQHAEEFGLAVPDPITGSLLATLAAGAATADNAGAIAVTPAAGVVGLYLLKGLGEKGHLTCIDPETEHQRQAKTSFQAAGYRTSAYRFLPSRPLEVMGRLANDSYQLVYGDVHPADLRAFVDAAWPLLSSGGVLIVTNALLDGTIADESRKDRDTVAARATDAYLRELDGALLCRLPLGAGLTIVTKR